MPTEFSDETRQVADRETVSTDTDRPTSAPLEITRTCPCGRSVPHNRKIYCSLKCKKLGPRIDIPCAGCGRVFPARKCALKEGHGEHCSRACSDAHARRDGRQAGPNNPRWVDGRWLSRKERWPAQIAARYEVKAAIRSGRMTRRPCERCGAAKAQAHHDDYSKPLAVRWLCRKHHNEVHRELKAAGKDPAPSKHSTKGT